jgi:phenylpropionate dioxygenase-like ring-hydroxylating dioxygenase large terminal subunit
VSDKIPPLPLNKTVVDVFADFLAYLLECASSFIQETHANGARLWESVKDELYFVLSHPNGWEGAQQAEMRKAAVLAKLIPDTTAGHARLSFVTEGEASLHFAVQNGLPVGVMEDGEGVVIVDAGGGTIDISSYSKNVGEAKNRFEEVAAPQCKQYLFSELSFFKSHHCPQAIFMARSL